MTLNLQTARASLLAMLMVTSVAVAGVSTAGGATAASVTSAIEYDGSVELALSEGSSVSVGASDVRVWVDGKSRSFTVDQDGSDGRIVLSGLGDVGPHRSMTVNVDASQLDTDNVSITVTGSMLKAGQGGNFFRGADVAYFASDTDVTFDIFKEGSYQVRRSTGVNSRLYVIDTDDTEVGAKYSVRESDGAQVTTEYHIRDLGLNATANRTQVPGSGDVTVSMSSRGADRPMVVRLVDADSGDVVRTKQARIGGDGTGSVTLADLSKGTYRVEVEDAITGITVETAEIGVDETTEGTVELVTKVNTDQRGDVMDVPLSFRGSATGEAATVTLGGSDLNFEVQFTVVDRGGDGRATVHWNTAESASADAGISVSGGRIEGSVDVVTGVDEPVTAGEYPLSVSYEGQETSVATAIVEARSTGGITVWTAPASVDGWDGLSDLRAQATQRSTVAIDPLTRNDDWVVLELQASGLEGYVEDVGDLNGANGLSLGVVESEDTVGPNQDPLTVDVDVATLLADGNNDTYYVAFQPDELAFEAEPGDRFVAEFSVAASENGATSSSQEVSATFEFVNGTASFAKTGGAVVAAPEQGATVTGTSTFAPGTELTVALRSEGGQSPFVETIEGVTVQPDGSWSATVDLSEGRADQTFTARVEKAGKTRASAQGELGSSAGATSTGDGDGGGDGTDDATPTGDGTPGTTDAGETDDGSSSGDDGEGGDGDDRPTATATTSPGFGLVVALLALLGAVLLARRE